MRIHVGEYLDRTVAQFPAKTAVIDAQGSYTFAELHRKAIRLANEIHQAAPLPNSPIGVYLPKCKEAVLSFAAIFYSGNCYAPLDVKSPPARLTGILKNLDPALVITTRALAPIVESAGFEASRILCIDEADMERAANLPPMIQAIDTDPLYIIHTSGSTGLPKGVTICHRGVIDYIDWAIETYRVDESFTIGSQAPFHFDNSTLDIYLCFATGATLLLPPDEKYLFPATLIPYLREHKVDLIFWVPSVLVSIANRDLLSQMELPDLRLILFAGEVMPTRHLNYWRTWFPRALFSNLYGPTEITVDCTYYIVEREFADHEPLPIGFPCRNSDILILNADNQRVQSGEVGELCVRGSSLALGYWNDPEKTAAAFCHNPLQPHYPERIYRTGDLVQLNERNEILYLGRNDGQIKHQGHRIELGEIETAAFSLPEVRNACVLYNKETSQIVLWYESEGALEIGQIRAALARLLPNYMLPAVCNWLDRLPLNANGKTDRQALLEALRCASA